ncbi:MAG: hypothetical protein Q9211_006365, partial [Gyalolechia sp. 1 TL-2023]
NGKANGDFRDEQPIGSYKWDGTPISHPDDVLRDMTNIRQPGYLEKNSFAQERHMRGHEATKTKVQSRVQPQPAVVTSRPLAGSIVQRPLAQAESNSHPAGQRALTSELTAIPSHRVAHSLPAPTTRSRVPSQASMVRPPQTVNEHQAFALARLEGRVPPPPASPIQRVVDHASLYGSHVQLERERPRLVYPQPLRVPSARVWINRFEEEIGAGFDCALEAPLTPEAELTWTRFR